MDKKTVFIKTEKGENEAGSLSSDLKRILMLIDNKSTSGELAKRAPPSLRESWVEIVNELEAGGYIRDKDKHIVEPKITKPKFNPLKMFTPKPEAATPRAAAEPPMDDLDFSNMGAAPVPNKAETAAREHDEMEAAVAAAKVRASAEAAAKAEAKAKQEAEAASRAKAAAEAKAKQETLMREQAEAKAKQETAARKQAQQEAERAKSAVEAAARAKAEAEAKVRAEIEAAARAQQEAEARIKREAEARAREEIEAAARAQQEAEARIKAEAEAARLKAEEEAARVKAELAAAAKAKAEAEEARLRAEAEAARIKAELAAAKARAEAEAKALAEARARELAEEKARQEAEARLKAEQQAAARLKAEQEAEAARLKAKQEAEAARIRAEQEAAAKREAEENARRAAELAEQEAQAAKESSPPAAPEPSSNFEIKLDSFLGTPEPEKKPAKSGNQERQAKAEAEAQARFEAEQRAATEAKAKSEKAKQKNMAAEMERLKEEADKARLKAEAEARQKAEEQALAEEQAKAWAEAEHRAKTQAVLEAEQAAQQAALSQAKAKAPVRRKTRKPLPLGKFAFGLIMLALVVAVALPYVYPLKEYIAPLEKILSTQLKQPVHIGAMSASSLPPSLQLQNVTIGSEKEVKIRDVILNFDPLSLFSRVRVIGDAELQEVRIAGHSLNKQAASLALLGSIIQYPVRHLTIQKLTIVTDEIKLPSLSGIADLDTLGAFSRISLHSPDDKLGVDLNSDAGRWQIGVNLKESSLPVLPDVVFSDLSAKGVLSEHGVNFTEMDAHIFEGILLGTAQLSWNRGWQLNGTLEAKSFNVDKMFPDFHVEGDMYGDGTFSMYGSKLSKMDDAPHLDGTFTVKKGTFNVDMVETARLLSRDNLVGGRTHFEEMSGQISLENHTTHFRQLKITSEMLNSSGTFTVSSGNQLSGNFNAEIKMRSGNNQLTLYGTTTEPKLRAGH